MTNTKLINLAAKAVGVSSAELSSRIKRTLLSQTKCRDIKQSSFFSPTNRKLFNAILRSNNVATLAN